MYSIHGSSEIELYHTLSLEDDREPGKDVKSSMEFEVHVRDNVFDIEFNHDSLTINEPPERPKTFIREFIHEEKLRYNDLSHRRVDSVPEVIKGNVPSMNGSLKKCYTCFPRKKVKDHIIQKRNSVSFHHDMCSRSLIIVTPDRHCTDLSTLSPVEIGTIFSEIDEFCRAWNIIDYQTSYNQGSWQTHKHFHVKIKSHDAVIKRMKFDHFKLLKLQSEYSN